jgi:intein/homing endonuclease
VKLADSTAKLIENVEPGDTLLTIHEGTGKVFAARVKSRYQQDVSEIVRLHLSTGELIVTTPRQPFMTTRGKYVPASQLKTGDRLITKSKPVKLDSVQHRAEVTRVHELRLHNASNYLVGVAALRTKLKKVLEDRPVEEATIGGPRRKRPAIGPRPPRRAASKR